MIPVASVTEMADRALVLSQGRRPAGRRLTIVTFRAALVSPWPTPRSPPACWWNPSPKRPRRGCAR